METKRCSKCGEIKSVGDFYVYRINKHRPWCKACFKEYNQLSNSKARKAIYAQTPQQREYKNKWRNSRKGRAYMREYRQTYDYKLLMKELRQTSKYKTYAFKWRQTHKGKALTARMHSKRRALEKNLPCNLTAVEWEEIKERQNYKCAICGEEKPLQRDHIIPLSKGGGLTKSNIQGLCNSCNARKGNRYLYLTK